MGRSANPLPQMAFSILARPAYILSFDSCLHLGRAREGTPVPLPGTSSLPITGGHSSPAQISPSAPPPPRPSFQTAVASQKTKGAIKGGRWRSCTLLAHKTSIQPKVSSQTSEGM